MVRFSSWTRTRTERDARLWVSDNERRTDQSWTQRKPVIVLVGVVFSLLVLGAAVLFLGSGLV